MPYREMKAQTLDEYDFMLKKSRAVGLLNAAIKRGQVKKTPCLVCGLAEVEGHHPNYDAPLDVVWLCKLHHVKVHHENGL